MSQKIFSVNGISVSSTDVLTYMKLNGSYNEAKRNVVMNEVIRDHAEHSGLKIESDTLQVYSDLVRMQIGLHNSAETSQYLNNLDITLEDWEAELENELYRELLRKNYGTEIFLLDAWRLIEGIPEVRKHLAQAIKDSTLNQGVEVSDAELQEASDSYRRLMGMHGTDEFTIVLEALKMTHQDWENHVHANVGIMKLGMNNFKDLVEAEVKSALQKYPIINNLISDMLFGSIIHSKAKKNNITLSESEVQEFFDDFRRTIKLHSAKSFSLWLAASGLSLDEFTYVIETELLKRKFGEQGIDLFNPAQIDKYLLASTFFSNALNQVKVLTYLYDRAKSEGILVSDGEINTESEYLRRVKSLHSSSDFNNYLETSGISLEQWETLCEKAANIRKLYDRETTESKISNYIASDANFNTYVKNATFGHYVNQTTGNIKVSF